MMADAPDGGKEDGVDGDDNNKENELIIKAHVNDMRKVKFV